MYLSTLEIFSLESLTLQNIVSAVGSIKYSHYDTLKDDLTMIDKPPVMIDGLNHLASFT
jgi:hypothetical protein